MGSTHERSTTPFSTLEARARELENDAHRDPLTGLHNRAWFDAQLAEAFGLAFQARTPLAVLIADIDGLHAINQRYGHGAGDKVIFSVAACLKRRLRPSDLVARHAGAAFTVLLPGAPADIARIVAERLRAGVADVGHDIGVAQTLRVTISLGCASLTAPPAVTASGRSVAFVTRAQLLEGAVAALATAKRDGRDRAVATV